MNDDTLQEPLPKRLRVTPVLPGIEVVTEQVHDHAHTFIHGGELDGERYWCGLPSWRLQHSGAVGMVRIRRRAGSALAIAA